MREPTKEYDAIIIGAGPSGMMAAGRAGERGKRVLLLEKKASPGKKLFMSGKGRCNITNAGGIDEHLENFGKSGSFLRNAFARVFTEELREFFESRGVPLKTERGGRVFPVSDRSDDILRALIGYMSDGKVDVVLNGDVKDVQNSADSIKKVIVSGGMTYASKNVAICTGGLSYPATGSTGFGFEAAKRLGHKVEPPRPALVPLVSSAAFVKKWQGISLKNVAVAMICNGKRTVERFGEMIFTHFGLSGPMILDISGDVYDALRKGRKVSVSINFKPALTAEKLDARLVREFRKAPNKSLKNIFRELLPVKMIPEFIHLCDVDPMKKCGQTVKDERKSLVSGLMDLRIAIKSIRGIEEAIVTRGGVNIKEIDPRTMESKLVKGLYFAGEVIDVDAKTGGYNMQAAFSTGYLCGDNI